VHMKYELQMWASHILSSIPGNIGCWLREKCFPCSIGLDSKIWNNVHIDKPSKLEIGNNVSINHGRIINAGGGVKIGNDVLIGPNVIIYSQNHGFDNSNKSIREQGYNYKEFVIGNGAWIACRVIILL
jgi:maltose O-acetyltransferase